jgi:uncharacterized membrane protein YkoI
MNAMRRIGALALLSSAISLAAAQPASHPLANEARVTEAQARAKALARVPGGTVKSHELEKENGRLIWTFDIAVPRTPGVTEVHVDAKTGKVVAVKKETPAEEEKEAKEER